MRIILVLAISIVSVCSVSCGLFGNKKLNIERTSPNGKFRVKVDVLVHDEGDFAGHFTEQGSIQVFKGQETIYKTDWNYRDNWEENFLDKHPSIEWVGDNILRMGRNTSGQPFTNELVILNDTDETLKHFGLSCGKFETFDIFEIGPRTQVILRPAPGLNGSVPGEFSAGYGGDTVSGKSFTGALTKQQPNSSIRLEIKVSKELS